MCYNKKLSFFKYEKEGILLAPNSNCKGTPTLSIFSRYKMSEIVNKFLLAENKFFSVNYLRKPRLK